MNRAEIEHRREAAVLGFLSENEGSVVVRETTDTAVIRTGGFTPAQVKAHAIMCFISVGLWVPVFVIVAILRHPRGWLLKVNRFNGEVEIRAL